MLILLDNNAPRGLAPALTGHMVTEARERGWSALKNGELLDAAEEAGFNVITSWCMRSIAMLLSMQAAVPSLSEHTRAP